MTTSARWLFADQLGPHFHAGGDLLEPTGSVLLIESAAALRRRPYHRQKLHLILSGMRHLAADLSSAGRDVTLLRAPTYRAGLAEYGRPVQAVAPTSWAAVDLLDALQDAGSITEVLPTPGFALPREDFATWAAGRRRLLMEDFYRDQRRRFGVLLEPDGGPVGGRWNYDADNREPPPRVTRLDVDEPWWPDEDDVDAEVRADLDAMAADGRLQPVGHDGPRRFAVTRAEALAALTHFVETRLASFGRYEDAMLRGDTWMAHSLLSVPLNLGLLQPLEVVEAAVDAYRTGLAPLPAVEGFVRQVLGWREYIWQVYWWAGRRYREHDELGAQEQLPEWFLRLDAEQVDAACLHWALSSVADHGWTHHIPRLMLLGNYGLQRGWSPDAMTEWFQSAFVDGFDWVMPPNVVGMSQHADGGLVATKPYAAGGAYINRMSDFCGGCRYDPKVRVGPTACPFTAGYWAFLDRVSDRLAGNPRMGRALQQRERLRDLDVLVDQERRRGSSPP